MENVSAQPQQAPKPEGKKSFLTVSCLIFLIFWMADAFLSSYYSHYFIANGMDATQQSILLGIIPFALFLGCLVLSPIAKTSRMALRMFQLCALIEGALSFVFVFCSSFWALLPITFLLGFFNGAPFAFIEGYVAPRVKAYGVPFSVVRMCATFGYIVSLTLGYFVLSNLPIQDCYYFSGSLFIAAFIISFFLDKNIKVRHREKKTEKPAVSGKFISKTLIIFLISQLLLYGGFNAMNYLLPVHLKGLGLSDAEYSLIRAIGVSAEFIMMLLIPLFAKKIRRYKTPILVASFICFGATSCGVFITDSYGLAYSAFILSGIGKALIFAYQSLFLEDIVGRERLAEALTINTGLVNLTSALLNLLSSTIYTAWGFPAYFGLISGMELLGIVFVFLIRVHKPDTQPE